MPTGHVTGVGRRPIWASISSSSSSGSRPGRSYLLRNVSTGQPAGAADLEQLEGLGLDALGRVEHHDDGVDAGEDAVRVLGEVAVAGRVEQVDDVVAVRELQHGRADRDAALALELHPVRRRRAPAVACLDRTGSLHGAGVEQELLGQRRLAGVGVADDGERPAARRLAAAPVPDPRSFDATGGRSVGGMVRCRCREPGRRRATQRRRRTRSITATRSASAASSPASPSTTGAAAGRTSCTPRSIRRSRARASARRWRRARSTPSERSANRSCRCARSSAPTSTATRSYADLVDHDMLARDRRRR